MAELKDMTVQALRELARKALGRGHSKLKTKGELIEALQTAQRKVSGAAERATSKLKEASRRGARAAGRMAGKVAKKGGERARSLGQRVRSAPAVEAEGAAAGGARAQGQGLDPEGHMVARVAGEEAARVAPHPMTEGRADAVGGGAPLVGVAKSAARVVDERLGELPEDYGEDVLMALPRDPRTLFIYWDHCKETLRRAWAHLDQGRPQIWLYMRERSGWARIRTVDFALESRSYYLHDIEPGRVYCVELHVVDRHGRSNVLSPRSNEIRLPAEGPSPLIDDRFMRILWREPLQRLIDRPYPGLPLPDEFREELLRLSDWSRFSAAWGQERAGMGTGTAAGGMGGRASSPSSWPRSSGGKA